ncbi:Alliinase, C-terminal [Dillenia turbinata]|uniref:Alliinase, C-terminal n=1 Tax=Dillenia turbinata TaxID=194707 RepID=A0AAN8Z4S7_9MAGN
MGRISRVFTWRHFLILSLALNVGFVLRFVNEGVTSRAEQSIGNGFCVDEKMMKFSETVMADGEAHVSKRSSHVSSSVNACTDGEDRVINLDHGDPTMYEQYWQRMGEETTIVISGWQSMSYFSDVKNLCWFLEPVFAREIITLHKTVGNAITEGYHIVVGTGSTQLFQAALYALSPSEASRPISVVSAAPYYSSYPSVTDYLKSGLYRWAGDAHSFSKDEPYIELVTSPNNPDGFVRQAVVNRSLGIVVHDFAYYWPQYTPISYPANHDLMLFTVSKSTGHAGMRIGWALVKDEEVARRMTKFIELNTIGVSKDSQLRAAKILRAVSDSCEKIDGKGENFFKFGYNLMAGRWRQLRAAAHESGLFNLPEFPPAHCNFLSRAFEPQPAFAWLKCDGEIEDCESFLRSHKILTRSGRHFGVSPKYVRVSMLDRDEIFDLFVERLSNIH